MNDLYKYQAKATRKFGVEFRSKLEAQWAYFFDQIGIEWNYVDSHTHDFVILGSLPLEVKPNTIKLAESAMLRLLESGSPSLSLLVLGDPNEYVLWTCVLCDCNQCVAMFHTQFQFSKEGVAEIFPCLCCQDGTGIKQFFSNGKCHDRKMGFYHIP